MKKYIIKTHQFFREASYAPFILGIFVILFWCIPSLSQTAQPPKQDKKVTIILTVAEVDVILNALGSLPYKDAAGVIQSIYGQASKQLADTTKPKK